MTTARSRVAGASLAFVLLTLAACSPGAVDDDAVNDATEEDVDAVVEEEEPREFTLPDSCRSILPDPAIERLTSGEVDLLRGPGSGSTETVYPAGPSPQEERGGISCLFGNIEETRTYTVSVAPMTQATRAEVIDGLLAQQLNPGQTLDGALTYWIQGDQENVPAIYNAVYPDSWYEVLIFPGGRIAYEEAESMVSQMRDYTTQ